MNTSGIWLVCTALFMGLCGHVSVAQEAYGPAFDADVTRISVGLQSTDSDTVEEIMVQLRWAGISDPRIFLPLVEELRTNPKLRTKIARRYVDAIAMSGHPQMLQELQALAADDSVSSTVRKAARKQIQRFPQYRAITERMSAKSRLIPFGAK